jgi:hypothetical protein
MKASELITLLQDAIDKYGDLLMTDCLGGHKLKIEVCDKDGYYVDSEKSDGVPYEIYLDSD